MKNGLRVVILVLCLISCYVGYAINDSKIQLESVASASSAPTLDPPPLTCWLDCLNRVQNSVMLQRQSYLSILDPDTDNAYLLLLYGPNCPSSTHHIDQNCVDAWKVVYMEIFEQTFWANYQSCIDVGGPCCELDCFYHNPCTPSPETSAAACMDAHLDYVFEDLKEDLESCCIPN